VSGCNPYLESLLNYITRHHRETPTNRVMELRPDHEAPPRNQHGITPWPMRQHHEISPRDSWNYTLTNEVSPRNYHGIASWPMRHHHATVMELRSDQWGTTMRSHLEIHGITSWPMKTLPIKSNRISYILTQAFEDTY